METERSILPLHCFGNIGYYRRLMNDNVVIDIHEHYVKQSLRNRYELCGAQGRYALAVPISGLKGQRLSTAEVRIANEDNWGRQHWRTIKTNYAAAPYFDYYADDLERVLTARHERLIDFSLAAHDLICEMIGTPRLKSSQGLVLSQGYVDADADDLDLRSTDKQGKEKTKEYIQVFSDRQPFHHDLSVLDALLCCGPDLGGSMEK